jgi:hypothetical protein
VQNALHVTGSQYLGKHDLQKITNIIIVLVVSWPVPMAARPKARTVFDRSNTGIVGSNPDRGIDVCPRFSVLCCPV